MRIRHLLLFFLLTTFFSCSTKHQKTESTVPVVAQTVEKQELKTGEIIPTVFCKNDAAQSYALYLPKNYSETLKFPVIIFFDSHGSGSYPVGLYQSLADRFGYILMGSNNSKNGLSFDQTNLIVSSLIAEASSRFSTDAKQIALAGFSGGSKVALIGAANHPELVSVIYCGASIPFDQVQQLPPALGFAGVRDMNYSEVMTSGVALEEKKITHVVIEWNGKHEWPDSLTFEDAFYWSSFNAMRNNLVSIDHNLIKVFLQRKMKLISSAKNSLTQHDLYGRLIIFLQGISDVSGYQQKLESLMHSDVYRKEFQQYLAVLQMESNLKQNYMQCFESKDLKWWKDEVSRMRNLKTGEQAMMYQRLLGYLSLASYSYSNNAIKQNNFSAAQQFLSIYKLADPENSDQAFLSACLYARQGDSPKAIEALKEAIHLGLKDKTKLLNEESFTGIRNAPEFMELINKL